MRNDIWAGRRILVVVGREDLLDFFSFFCTIIG